MNTPALYEVDPDTDEALGTVHPFCSATCVEKFDGRTSYKGARLDLGTTDTDDFGFTPMCEGCDQLIGRSARIANYHAAIGNDTIYNNDEVEDEATPIGERRYVLIERSIHNQELYVTTHDTPEDASGYHDGQECPDDWPVLKLVDLDTGDESYPVCNTTWSNA